MAMTVAKMEASQGAAAAAPLGRVARKREAIRARLLEAGYEQAGRRGLDGIVIAELTEAADCSKGAFYLHFDNRDAFIAALINDALEPVGCALDAFGENQPADIALATGLRYTLTLALQNPAWGAFVSAVTRAADPMTQGFGRRIIADILRGREAGLFRYDDLGGALLMAGGVFLAGTIGALAGALTPHSPSEATRHVLLALGVPEARAARIAEAPLPPLAFQSGLVTPLAAG